MANGNRIVIQEPESGLDVFLKELSKYTSPQYQLSLREQNRADARLELSKRQMADNERKYQNSLKQQKFENDRAIASDNRAEEQFEINKRNSEYAIARQSIDDAFAGMNPRQVANTNIDSLLIGIEDPTVNLRSRKYAESIINRGKKQFEMVSSTLDIYNSQNPESPMTLDTALDVFRDDKSINKVFTDAYFSKGDLNDRQKALISSITPRLTSLRKQQADLLVAQASGQVGADDALAEVTFAINNLQSKLDSILQPSSTQRGDGNADPYSNRGTTEGGDPKRTSVEEERTTAIPDFLLEDYTPGEMAGAFASDDMYNVLFSDEEDIVDSAVDMANRNASGEDVKDVVIDSARQPADELDEGVTEKDIEDMLTEAKEEGKNEEVNFLENALSGLSSLGARERREPDIEPVEAELFSNVRPTEPSGIRKQDGSFVNVESLSSSIGSSLKNIKKLKSRYKKAKGNEKLIIARALSNAQSTLQELKPFISKEGTFSNKRFNDNFYKRLSKKVNMPIDDLKSLILFNMDYNI
tara:strand:+ start:6229 stop:7812 length:1584 start_codon:yes stop_codon:yes gene_type:complete